MTNYTEILRMSHLGFSQRSIASSCDCSKNTVTSVIKRAQDLELPIPFPPGTDNKALEQMLFPKAESSRYKKPDYEYVHKEMARSGVTLNLLWNEYREQCRIVGEVPFMYTQFCKYYRDFASKTKATMHIDHKPGEKMEVDWAGQTASIKDTVSYTELPVFIFVATLPCSGYTYAEGFLNQKQESWIAAHVNAYNYFGGVTRILVPDNLKTGVDKVNWFTPVINRTYHEMAEHYSTCIIPARVRKPKDKPSVESSVNLVSSWILAALRNREFFSLVELNKAMRERLEELNEKPFQKKNGSRRSAFIEDEREYLLPLPRHQYELASWKIATVQFNYHVAVDKMYYSVPYEYIKNKVDVRITKNVVEVFYAGNRVCSHRRLSGRLGQYSTVVDHMPPDHQKYSAWDSERFISWGQNIGSKTEIVVKGILASHTVEQQGYRACMGLLKLADKYSVARLESACARALNYSPSPSFKSVQSILRTGYDRLEAEAAKEQTRNSQHSFIRGAAHYADCLPTDSFAVFAVKEGVSNDE